MMIRYPPTTLKISRRIELVVSIRDEILAEKAMQLWPERLQLVPIRVWRGSSDPTTRRSQGRCPIWHIRMALAALARGDHADPSQGRPQTRLTKAGYTYLTR